MNVNPQLEDRIRALNEPNHKAPDHGEHLCFIWCDGKVDVHRLKTRDEAHTWIKAQAAVWHFVDKSRNAGTLMVPANESWHDVLGRDGIPNYVAYMVRSYLTKSIPDWRYRDLCLGVSPEVRARANEITREIEDDKRARDRERLRQRWATLTPAEKADRISSVHWASEDSRQLAADACASQDPEVILSLTPDMEVVDDYGWVLRRGDVSVRLYCGYLPELSGRHMQELVDKRELRWPPKPTDEPQA